jgi:hypothetical protein
MVLLLFSSFLLLLHTMDERRHKISIALVFTMFMHRVIAQVIATIAVSNYWTTLEYEN